MQTTVIRSLKSKAVIINIAYAALFIVIAVFLFLAIRKYTVDRAVREMDITDKQSVIRVMKYLHKDGEAVFSIAKEYSDNGFKSDAIKLLLYLIQYVDSENTEALKLLQDCYEASGSDTRFIASLSNPNFSLLDFKTVTEYCDDTYGCSDGVYCKFLGGYAKAKISSVNALSISACEDGVYVLDANDRYLKLLSCDGVSLQTVIDTRINEFIDFNGQIYYIDGEGIPHGTEEAVLSNGEFAMGLRHDEVNVYCTIYDSNYNALREIKLG